MNVKEELAEILCPVRATPTGKRRKFVDSFKAKVWGHMDGPDLMRRLMQITLHVDRHEFACIVQELYAEVEGDGLSQNLIAEMISHCYWDTTAAVLWMGTQEQVDTAMRSLLWSDARVLEHRNFTHRDFQESYKAGRRLTRDVWNNLRSDGELVMLTFAPTLLAAYVEQAVRESDVEAYQAILQVSNAFKTRECETAMVKACAKWGVSEELMCVGAQPSRSRYAKQIVQAILAEEAKPEKVEKLILSDLNAQCLQAIVNKLLGYQGVATKQAARNFMSYLRQTRADGVDLSEVVMSLQHDELDALDFQGLALPAHELVDVLYKGYARNKLMGYIALMGTFAPHEIKEAENGEAVLQALV